MNTRFPSKAIPSGAASSSAGPVGLGRALGVLRKEVCRSATPAREFRACGECGCAIKQAGRPIIARLARGSRVRALMETDMNDMPRHPHGFTYAKALAASQKVNWRIEDVIGGERRLDFAKSFLPESLAGTGALGFLSADEKRKLNHVRAHGYLSMFGLIEEFILPFVLDHAQPTQAQDDLRTRALQGFAMEEAKHIHLFRAFEREFEAGFGAACETIGPADAIGKTVLAHHPLAVALLILQVEWMTQRHYLESIRDDRELDERFRSLLRHHWIEEAQHAQLDTLMVESLADGLSAGETDEAVDGYLEIGFMLDGALRQQAAFDLDALQRATGRRFAPSESERIVAVQHQAMRRTYLGSGMSHPNFLGTVSEIAPARAAWLAEAAVAYL
jgi:hypothetical protein